MKNSSRKTNTKPRSRSTGTPRRSREALLSELPELSIFVRLRREQLGYTQEQLAFRSGLNLRFIREFELGKKTVRLDKVMQLLEFLGADLKAELRKPL
ncbi:MAG: helix-turn-helix domain-containing protein [Bdellovibrionales bacterium]